MNIRTVPILLVLVSLVLCAVGIHFGLPYLYHDDEQIIVKRALRFGSGDFNPHFFFYPSLHMYILFLAYGIYFIVGLIFGFFSSVRDFAHLYINNPTGFYLIGRGLSAVFATGIVVMTYLVGKKLYNETVGVLGGLFLIAIPNFVDTAHTIKNDVPMLFILMIFFYIALQIYYTGERKFYVLSGLTLGLATATKYNAIILVPVIVLVHLFYSYRSARGRARVTFKNLLFSPSLVLSGVFVIIGFVAGCPFAVLDFKTFYRHFSGILIFTATDKEFGQSGALLNYSKLVLYIGGNRPLLGIICILGVIAGVFRRKKEDLILISTILIIYLVCIRQSIQQWQSFYPAFPFLAISGARLVADSYKLINQKLKIVFVIIMSLILLDPLVQSVLNDYLISQKHARTFAKEWIESNIPENAKILVDNHGPQLLRSKELIQKQYEQSAKSGHLKEDYFKLQLEALPDGGYNWYQIKRDVIAPKEMGDYSQMVELSERVDLGRKYLKQKGFEYIVISKGKEIDEEEEMLDRTYKLLKEFEPKIYNKCDFRIKIYKI